MSDFLNRLWLRFRWGIHVEPDRVWTRRPLTEAQAGQISRRWKAKQR